MFTTRDTKLFQVARSLARTSNHSKARIGAVIVQDREILSVGVNGVKSHPLQQKYNRFRFVDDNAKHLMHAELDAIVKSKLDTSNNKRTSIYVYRDMADHQHGKSRPCAGCLHALKDYNINHIFYTTDDGFVYEQLI